MVDQKNLNKIVKSAGFVVLGILLSKLMSYFFRIIIARGLGSYDYGTFNLGLAVVGLIGVVALLGLNQGVVRYVAYYQGKDDKGKIKGTFWMSVMVGGTLSVVLGIFLYTLSNYIAINYFSNRSLSYILKLLALVIPLDVVSKLFLANLRAVRKIKYIVFSQNIISVLIRLLLTLFVLYLGFGLIGVVWSYIISIVFLLIIAVYYVKKKIPVVFDKRIKSSFDFKELFFYSYPLLLTALLYYIILWTDTLMIGYFKTSELVGVYNTAAPTASLILTFPLALTFIFLPTISYLISKGDKEEIRDLFNTVTRWVLTLNLPLTILLIVFSKQVIEFFFGLEYSSAFIPLMLLAGGQFIYSFFLTSIEVLKSIKKTGFILNVNIASAIFNIFLNLLLIPKYGIIGGAIATSSSYLLMGILLSFGTYNFFKIIPLKLEYFKQFFSGIILLFPLIYLSGKYNPNFYIVIFLSILYLLLYLGLLIILKIFKEEDLTLFNTIKTKLKNF